MFIPLTAERTNQRFSFVTYGLIAANMFIHAIVLIGGPQRVLAPLGRGGG